LAETFYGKIRKALSFRMHGTTAFASPGTMLTFNTAADPDGAIVAPITSIVHDYTEETPTVLINCAWSNIDPNHLARLGPNQPLLPQLAGDKIGQLEEQLKTVERTQPEATVRETVSGGGSFAMYAQIAATPAGEPDLDGEWYYFEEIEPTSDIQLNTQDKWQVKANGRTGICINMVEEYINRDYDPTASGATLSHTLVVGTPIELYGAITADSVATDPPTTPTKQTCYVFWRDPPEPCWVCDRLHDAASHDGTSQVLRVPSPLRITFTGITATDWEWNPAYGPGSPTFFDQAHLDAHINGKTFEVADWEQAGGIWEWYEGWNSTTKTISYTFGDLWIVLQCLDVFDTTAWHNAYVEGVRRWIFIHASLLFNTSPNYYTPVFYNHAGHLNTGTGHPLYKDPAEYLASDRLPLTCNNGLWSSDTSQTYGHDWGWPNAASEPGGWAGYGGTATIELPQGEIDGGCFRWRLPDWY
jgi:hypothetical protein